MAWMKLKRKHLLDLIKHVVYHSERVVTGQIFATTRANPYGLKTGVYAPERRGIPPFPVCNHTLWLHMYIPHPNNKLWAPMAIPPSRRKPVGHQRLLSSSVFFPVASDV